MFFMKEEGSWSMIRRPVDFRTSCSVDTEWSAAKPGLARAHLPFETRKSVGRVTLRPICKEISQCSSRCSVRDRHFRAVSRCRKDTSTTALQMR